MNGCRVPDSSALTHHGKKTRRYWAMVKLRTAAELTVVILPPTPEAREVSRAELSKRAPRSSPVPTVRSQGAQAIMVTPQRTP